LLAIAQISDTFHYLHWIPSDRGPLVTGFGEISIKPISLNAPGFIDQLIQSILQKLNLELPVFTLTLDTRGVLFSQTYIHSDFSPEDLIKWQLNQFSDERFQKSYRQISYPLAEQTETLLNIHVPEKLLHSLDVTMKKIYGEMRSVSVNIFSAEIGARYWMGASEFSSYIIWRMGKYNSDHLLVVKNNELLAFCHSKRSTNNVKKMIMVGDETVIDSFFEDLNRFHLESLEHFTAAQMVFVYQGEGRNTELKKICESGIDNIRLLNPLSVLTCEDVPKANLYLTSHLAETGVSFRGIDV